MSRRVRQRIAGCLVAIVASLGCDAARAHRLDEWLQATTVHVEPRELRLGMRIAPGAALAPAAIAEIDADGDGRFSPAEQSAFAERIHGETTLEIDGEPWSSRLRVASFPEPVQIREGTGEIQLQFEGPLHLAPGEHRLTLRSMVRHAGAVYLVNALQPQDESLRSLVQQRSADQSSYELDFTLVAPGTRGTLPLSATVEPSPSASTAWTFFLRGLRHILTGYDHLLFAAALALAARTIRELLLVITVFTLAHSTTLALAAFGLVHLPTSIVEPAISASIVVVALQNALWPGGAAGRSRLLAAFCFGLFHGLGFAGGLTDALQQMPRSITLNALAGFTLGIEIGQQCVVGPVFLLRAALPKLGRRGAVAELPAIGRWGSLAIALLGIHYFVQAIVADV